MVAEAHAMTHVDDNVDHTNLMVWYVRAHNDQKEVCS